MEIILTQTPRAKDKIQEVTKEKKYFRINVEAGGCAGYTYIFSLEDQIQSDDLVIDKKIIIDNNIAFLINDSILDYVEDLFSAKFVLSNQENTSCGCGKSFNK